MDVTVVITPFGSRRAVGGIGGFGGVGGVLQLSNPAGGGVGGFGGVHHSHNPRNQVYVLGSYGPMVPYNHHQYSNT